MQRTFTALVMGAALMARAGSAADARAEVSPRIRSLVDRYVEATGGRTAFDAERTVYVKGRIHSMGMSGTFEQWIQRPDKMLVRTSLGPIRTRVGYDGKTAWRTDLNSKKVTVLDGKDLEAVQSDAWFENEMWSVPGGDGTFKEVGSLAFQGKDTFRAIEIAPPVGPSRRLWFATRSGLVDRMVSRRDQHEWMQWVREWRDADRRKRWTVMTSMDPTPVPNRDPDAARWEERMTIDSIKVNADFGPELFSPPGSKPLAVAWSRTRDQVQVPFRYGTRHVWIKASINGAPPADFLLDTGCSITALDRDYADRIGLESEGTLAVQGASGTGEGSCARVKALRLGTPGGAGVTVRDLKVGLIDLGEGFEAAMWRKAAGLIGYDFLSHFVVTIDYDKELVTFRNPSTFTYEGATTPIPFKLFQGIPTVQATLNDGCSGEFVVDVGNSFGLDVHGSMVRRCKMLGTLAGHKQVEVYSGGIGGSAINWLTRLDKIKIGPHEWAEPIAGLSLGSHGLSGSQDYSGNIGNGILERFVCTFDYERRRLYLEPGRRFSERDRYSRSGTFLVRYAGRVYPGQIVSGSAAHDAGLSILDEVTAIDGKPAAGFTPEELDKLFMDGPPGASHTLTVERNGERRKLTLKLADVL